MRNERLMRARQRSNPGALAFVAKNLAIVDQVFDLMEERGWTQKDLAKKLGKAESEISKILSGMQNITLQTIVNLEVILGEDIIVTPKEYSQKIKTSVEFVAEKLEQELTVGFRDNTNVVSYTGHYQYKVEGKKVELAQVSKLIATKSKMRTVVSTEWRKVNHGKNAGTKKTA